MDSVREQIEIANSHSKVRSGELYSCLLYTYDADDE